MSEMRVEVVDQAFNALTQCKCPSGSGNLVLTKQIECYNANEHPRVKTREKSAKCVHDEFCRAILAKSEDGQSVDRSGWLGYYADVNACLPNEREDHFLDIIKNTWGLAGVLQTRQIRSSRLVGQEKILFEKIRQRTVGTDNEGKTLKKKFMYVDTYDEGVVDCKQFKQAMVELGSEFTDTEITAMFNMYSNNQPRLSYNDMCDYFKDLGLQAQSNLNPAYKEYRKLPETALLMIRKELTSRGYFGISYLRNIFGRADKNGNSLLDRNEFCWCLKECNINLTKTDYDKIFRYFDQNNDNNVSFTEFIEALTVPMNENRKVMVKYAYDYQRQTEATVTKNIISMKFNPKNHPEIEAGYMTKNEVLREFLSLFGDINAKGITLDSWCAVWTDISTNFKTDAELEKYMMGLFTA